MLNKFHNQLKDKKYSLYMLKQGDVRAKALFHPADKLPKDIPISTPFTFPFKQNKVYLCLDKMGWWNSLGGHIDDGETWQEAVTREAKEEAGVIIDNIKVVGYIYIEHLNTTLDAKYPRESIIPITISKTTKYLKSWQKAETKERGVFTLKEAAKLFKKREDNNQMLEIFEYIVNNFIK